MKRQCAAPRDSASSPTEPVPANRSSHRLPAGSTPARPPAAATMSNTALRTCARRTPLAARPSLQVRAGLAQTGRCGWRGARAARSPRAGAAVHLSPLAPTLPSRRAKAAVARGRRAGRAVPAPPSAPAPRARRRGPRRTFSIMGRVVSPRPDRSSLPAAAPATMRSRLCTLCSLSRRRRALACVQPVQTT